MNVLLVGFFGEGNLGDDAILEGIRTCLPPRVSLSVTAGEHSVCKGIKAIRRRGIASWIDFLTALKGSRRVIFSGGILQDWSYEGVTFFALRMIASGIFGRKPSIWGAGLGPLRKAPTKALAAKAIRRVRDVWLRDSDSVNVFREISSGKAHLGADWTWALSPSRKSGDQPFPAIGLNLRPWFIQTWMENSRIHLADLIQTGETMGISARGEDEKLLKTQFPEIKVLTPADFSSLIDASSSLREGWAMRYHVLLAMLRAGIPVVPLPYDGKVLSLCREAGVAPNDNHGEDFRARRPNPYFIPALDSRFNAMRRAFTNYFAEAMS